MTQRDFQIMCAIQYEGLDNSMFTFVEDIDDPRSYFGIDCPFDLKGKWLVVWREKFQEEPSDYSPLHFQDGRSFPAIQPDHVVDDQECQFMLFYKLDDDKDCVKAVRAVNFFAWNNIDGRNYDEVANRIHKSDCWNYKYAEIIYNKNCFAWGACLLHDLPHEQAQQLIDYCLDFYKDWARL